MKVGLVMYSSPARPASRADPVSCSNSQKSANGRMNRASPVTTNPAWKIERPDTFTRAAVTVSSPG